MELKTNYQETRAEYFARIGARPIRRRQRYEVRDDLIKVCLRYESPGREDDELQYCDDMIDEFAAELTAINNAG